MTADSVDLEDYYNMYNNIACDSLSDSFYAEEMTYPPHDEFKSPELSKSQTSLSPQDNSFTYPDDLNIGEFDSFESYLEFQATTTNIYEGPFADFIADCINSDELLSNSLSSRSDELLSNSLSSRSDELLSNNLSSRSDELLSNSSVFLSEMECCTTLVPFDAILPQSPVIPDEISPLPVKEEDSGDEAVDSIWTEINDFDAAQIVDSFGEALEHDLFRERKRRKFTHEFDHSYSIRPFEDRYDFSPYSPASSSCSDKSRGVKRTRAKKKAVKLIKIKKEIISSDEEEVDVETPFPIQLVVPKLTISLGKNKKTGPAKRGRKPKNKSEGQNVGKKSSKNCPVSAKALQAAIKQQKQRCYITKSGRVSNKISNSVETTPSTSTPSSLSNSRCTSDNEDNVDKRASHNMAERNRRQELTKLFQNVRIRVPEIERNLKASKVQILTAAARHVGNLERIDKAKASQKQQLEAEIKKKLAMVQSLRISRGYAS